MHADTNAQALSRLGGQGGQRPRRAHRVQGGVLQRLRNPEIGAQTAAITLHNVTLMPPHNLGATRLGCAQYRQFLLRINHSGGAQLAEKHAHLTPLLAHRRPRHGRRNRPGAANPLRVAPQLGTGTHPEFAFQRLAARLELSQSGIGLAVLNV